MAIKKKSGGGGGANWMDTYGDMVTLLLCFFVLLYSMSSISEDKWKAIVQSFNPNAITTATDPEGNSGPFGDDVGNDNPGLSEVEQAQNEIENMMEELFAALQNMSKQEGIENAVSVSMDGGKIYLKFQNEVFFAGDSYVLRPSAQELLLDVCAMLDASVDAIEEIRVMGHTAQQYDNEPNEVVGDRYLASNRGTSVVVFLQEHSSINPARLISEGAGQWRPISPNNSEENRAPNRRVEMVISAKEIGSKLDALISQYEALDEEGLTQ